MWKEIKPEECRDNAFSLIGKEWMLITAGDEKKANAMTASWGGIGVMWGKNVAYLVVRPQRYTKEFLDREERFSLNFLPEEYRKALNYMGTVSGRDEDKMAGSGLTEGTLENVPMFEESRMVMVCKKLFVQEMKEESFLQKETIEKWYPQKDYHTLYIAEIEKVYVQEA
ncbi:MAG: flavin reductase family protein [Lachnospiraceae bacterium]|nr:flavin reductase family protein [Lachnospiraceae bacterium]